MRVALAVLAVAACLAAGLPACDKVGCASSSRETPSLAVLGQRVGLKFPPSTRLIGTSTFNGMDDLTQLTVEMSLADLPAFLAASPVPPDAFSEGTGGFLGGDDGYWDPHKAKNLRTGQAIVPDNRALNIGVADGPPSVAILYIVNHGT